MVENARYATSSQGPTLLSIVRLGDKRVDSRIYGADMII